jgi:integrase
MPRPKSPRTPSLRHHAAAKQGVVRLNRHDHYLGRWTDGRPPDAVQENYDRLITRWLANGRRPVSVTGGDVADAGPTVYRLIIEYMDHAVVYYRRADGTPTNELGNVRRALRVVRRLFGDTPARAFDSLALEAVRDRLIADGRCRSQINKDVGRVRRMFKWGAAKKLVPLTTHQLLQTVEGLRAGRSAARESAPVTPVDDQTVELTLPFLTAVLRAMVRLQRLTGVRPGEVCAMRVGEIDAAGEVWYYRPLQHKTAHRGRTRAVPLGPQAQALLAPFLDAAAGGGEGYLFSPRASVAASRAERRSMRKTVVQPSQQDRSRGEPKRKPGDRYSTATYAGRVAVAARKAAIARLRESQPDLAPNALAAEAMFRKADAAYRRAKGQERERLKATARQAEREYRSALDAACKVAGWTASWHPNQLRHAHGTEVRRRYGLEGAQVALGHSRADVTQVYAERDRALAERIACEVG